MTSIEQYRQANQRCEICHNPTQDIHHIKTRGSGGTDHFCNLLALCRLCHVAIHQEGTYKTSKKHPHLAQLLEEKGWEYMEWSSKKWLPPPKASKNLK